MTLIPPNIGPSYGTVVIPGTGMVPLVAGHPNSKPIIWRNPWLKNGTDRNLTLRLVKFHNTHATVTYTVAWGTSFNSLFDYTNGAGTVAPPAGMNGTSDPACEHDWFDIPPHGSITALDADDPIVLAPNMAIFAWEAQKGTILGPPSVAMHITGEWGPMQS